ncbi:hypothetical protein [Candidatus Pyrohabitans sp.]
MAKMVKLKAPVKEGRVWDGVEAREIKNGVVEVIHDDELIARLEERGYKRIKKKPAKPKKKSAKE